MAWTPPANRSNQHIKRYRFDLYVMPTSDKTGILSDLTERANQVLASITYKYPVGLRVVGINRKTASHVVGEIRSVTHNIGINEYLIRDDNDLYIIVAERDIRSVLSITVVPNDQLAA